MSLRRKSCDACFKGRRKCDLGYPACSTCRRTKKSCHYIYAPVPSASLPDGSRPVDGDASEGCAAQSDVPVAFVDPAIDQFGSVSAEGRPASDAARALRAIHSDSMSLQSNTTMSSTSSASLNVPPARPRLNIPNFLGCLGEVQRVEGSTDSWSWVIGELKRCPRDLATRGETLFLHKNLYCHEMPRSIRAALGNSAAFCTLDEDKRQLLFRALDAEVLELIRTDAGENRGHPWEVVGTTNISDNAGGLTLVDELARLQAFTLYQMMRIFGGDLEQHFIVEQQRDLLTTWALHLLRRSMAELGGAGHHGPSAHHNMDSWHTWILGESIRRTVMVVYMFYGVYSLAKRGYCVELPTLAKLPVSKAPASWYSEAAYMAQGPSGEGPQTLTYEEFTDSWMKSPPQTIDPFDKLLMVPCKGLEVVSP